jgi:hypothetical protein
VRRSPSTEFRRHLPECPIAEVTESDRKILLVGGWLDVVKFDAWLTRAYGFDGNDTLGFVRAKFGENAAQALMDQV